MKRTDNCAKIGLNVSLRNLCVFSASRVECLLHLKSGETQRTQKLRREEVLHFTEMKIDLLTLVLKMPTQCPRGKPISCYL